ncbi:MAG: hypothetical protein GFH27_549283n299 [Chloroflexi bacterium AL-W]|nr:hypothetical protein [Chloroflexi bacterium AL-N1]NOK64579.1 hypothetical protein [Chloroflexi bacterium AL-N10]NOK75821.1 hypothetical protein [Chloroflexi bacterium AL-N5]NOK80420.1 hypothetical protein [Chloroflexi bacterium AL-W]NOK86934.1 hypothetical protein [Chloroflexi bacterium AL-N15]
MIFTQMYEEEEVPDLTNIDPEEELEFEDWLR